VKKIDQITENKHKKIQPKFWLEYPALLGAIKS